MIRLFGKYRLTFPVTPAEIGFKGYGNDIESVTTISLLTRNRIGSRRPKLLVFDFWLPGDIDSPLIEVDGYQGPRAWLDGIDRLYWEPVLITIDELSLAWNVFIGPLDGTFKGANKDFYGTIELPMYIKDEFMTWTNSTQLLTPPTIISKQVNQRANTTGKTAKKKNPATKSPSIVNETLKTIQRSRVDKKLTDLQLRRLE